MKTVLVTGANGFIGRHVMSHLLSRDFTVHAAGRNFFRSLPGVTVHSVDLLTADEGATLIDAVRPSHLLHLAWNVEHPTYWSSLENLRWVDASLRLLVAFAKAGGRRWLGIGTCAEYDSTASGLMDERSTPLRPNTLYGASKLALCTLSQAAARELGISAAWGRVFHLYGPHERPGRLVPAVIQALLDGRPALCTHGSQQRDFMHVNDVAQALVLILAGPREGPINVCSGRAVTISEVANCIARAIGRPDLVQLGALKPAPADPDALVGSAETLKSLGFGQARSLDEGIRETVRWWVEQRTISTESSEAKQ